MLKPTRRFAASATAFTQPLLRPLVGLLSEQFSIKTDGAGLVPQGTQELPMEFCSFFDGLTEERPPAIRGLPKRPGLYEVPACLAVWPSSDMLLQQSLFRFWFSQIL